MKKTVLLVIILLLTNVQYTSYAATRLYRNIYTNPYTGYRKVISYPGYTTNNYYRPRYGRMSRKINPYYRYERRPIIYHRFRGNINNNIKNVAYNGENIDLNTLSRLENKILGRNYAYDETKSRIERIEEKMFGACQSGDIKERFNTISHAAKSYKTYNAYNNYEDRYSPCYQDNRYNGYTPPIVSGGGVRSMLGSLGNYMFGGYPTGFTPQMDPAYMDYFEAERQMQNSDSGENIDIRTNTGYYKHRANRQSGMGVTLLD